MKPSIKKTEVFKEMNVNVRPEAVKSLIESVQNIIDLDSLYSAAMTCFRKKTIKSTPQYVKVIEANPDRQREVSMKFLEKVVLPVWKECIEPGEDSIAAASSILNKEDLLTYIFGIYLAVHSQNISDKEISKEDFIKYTFAEMAVYAARKGTFA